MNWETEGFFNLRHVHHSPCPHPQLLLRGEEQLYLLIAWGEVVSNTSSVYPEVKTGWATAIFVVIRKHIPIQKGSLFHSKLRYFTLRISIGGPNRPNRPKPIDLRLYLSCKSGLVSINDVDINSRCESEIVIPVTLHFRAGKMEIWREEVTCEKLASWWEQSRIGPRLSPKQSPQQIAKMTFCVNYLTKFDKFLPSAFWHTALG